MNGKEHLNEPHELRAISLFSTHRKSKLPLKGAYELAVAMDGKEHLDEPQLRASQL